LEDAQIKLSVVASDVFGVSGRVLLAALVAGERDPKVLARMARTRMPAKTAQLEEAFVGRFSDHHAVLLQTMLGRIDQASADIAELDRKIDEAIAPFAEAADRLDAVTGIGRTAAQVVIAEVGVDMARFPTAGHLVSWAKFAPGVKESAGKGKGKHATGHGNRYLARVLGEAAVAAGRTNSFLGERDRRLARRAGAPSGPWSRSAAPSWSSSGSCCWIPPSATRISVLAATTPGSTPNAASATTSANSTRSATRSPSSLPPDLRAHRRCVDPAALRCAGCWRLPGHR
jgi:Transposase IS116/IS110/IS902 family